MGNAFVIDSEAGTLRLNPERSSPQAPIVHLSSNYEYVDDFLKHFPYIPDMLELDTLTIKEDVYFGRDIKLKVSFQMFFSSRTNPILGQRHNRGQW